MGIGGEGGEAGGYGDGGVRGGWWVREKVCDISCYEHRRTGLWKSWECSVQGVYGEVVRQKGLSRLDRALLLRLLLVLENTQSNPMRLVPSQSISSITGRDPAGISGFTDSPASPLPTRPN